MPRAREMILHRQLHMRFQIPALDLGPTTRKRAAHKPMRTRDPMPLDRRPGLKLVAAFDPTLQQRLGARVQLFSKRRGRLRDPVAVTAACFRTSGPMRIEVRELHDFGAEER